MIIDISKLDSDIKYQIYIQQCEIDNNSEQDTIDHKDFCKFLSDNYKDTIIKQQLDSQQQQQKLHEFTLNYLINIINYFNLIFYNNINNNNNNTTSNFINNNNNNPIIKNLKQKTKEIFKLFLIYINNEQYLNIIIEILNKNEININGSSGNENIFKSKLLLWLQESIDNSIKSGMEMLSRKELLNTYSVCNDYNNTIIAKEEERIIKVFNEETGELNKDKYDFKLDVIDEYEAFNHPTIYSIKNRWYGNSYNRGSFSVVPNIEIFKKSFSLFTSDLLDGIKWRDENDENNTRIVVYGGSILCCLESFPTKPSLIKDYIEMIRVERLIQKLPLPRYLTKIISRLIYNDHSFIKNQLDKQSSIDSPYYRSDIDISIVSNSLSSATRKLKEVASQIIENLQSINCDYRLVRTPNSISIISQGNRIIQLIIMFTKTIEEQILFHDIDCISTCYDGFNIYLHTRSLRALNRRTNLISIKTLTHSYSRLLKYSLRGFNSIAYQLCEHIPRCDMKDHLYKHAKEINQISQEKQHQILNDPTSISRKDLLEYQTIDFPVTLNNDNNFDLVLHFLYENLPGLYSQNYDDLIDLDLDSNLQKTKFGNLKSIQFKNNCNL